MQALVDLEAGEQEAVGLHRPDRGGHDLGVAGAGEALTGAADLGGRRCPAIADGGDVGDRAVAVPGPDPDAAATPARPVHQSTVEATAHRLASLLNVAWRVTGMAPARRGTS
jgi:hypothetical protein